MASYNKVILMGNLTRDPELRYTPSGMAVCKVGIAVNSSFGGGDGRKEETLFINVVTFNKQAENCGQYLKKGNPILVDGRLQTSSWENDAGEKRYSTEVVANVVQFLSKGTEGGGNYSTGGYNSNKSEEKIDISSIEDIPEDQIPF
jgi:single-strand DNA-binding protein